MADGDRRLNISPETAQMAGVGAGSSGLAALITWIVISMQSGDPEGHRHSDIEDKITPLSAFGHMMSSMTMTVDDQSEAVQDLKVRTRVIEAQIKALIQEVRDIGAKQDNVQQRLSGVESRINAAERRP